MAEQEYCASVVLDCGSELTKAGMAGNDAPCAVFPSLVGRLRHNNVLTGLSMPNVFVGREAKEKRGILSLKYPVERSSLVNWEDMEALWRHALCKELCVAPEESSVLLTEFPLVPKKNRTRTTEIMFETFSVSALCLASQPRLSLYSCSDRDSGVVVESGGGEAYVVPIYNGTVIGDAVQCLYVCGRRLTDFLASNLSRRGFNIITSDTLDLIHGVQEKNCYVALDYDKEMQRAESHPEEFQKSITVTEANGDTKEVILGREMFHCAEPIFQPQLLGLSTCGLSDAICNSVRKCDVTIRNELFSNIVLSGGNTMFPGIAERLKTSLRRLAPVNTKVEVIAHPNRNYGAWRGGSIFAALQPHSENEWIKRFEYEEHGLDILDRKRLS